MDKLKFKTMMQSARKVAVSELNECITCKLCKGYFVDATTIIECLHTFCRSCIVCYLESNKYCPICDVQVHKTKPLLNLRPDKTIQDIVYKLVPRLFHNEMRNRKVFYETHPDGKPSPIEELTIKMFEYILAPDESVNLTLSYHGSCGTPRYLRCPSAVSITHLKKLIRAKYDLTDRHRVDVYYKQECLHPTFTLMDLAYIYSWKRKDPIELTFKIYECRAKRQKLETTENSDKEGNFATNNNNNWKEVQLRISENGEMSITGIEDSNMLELLDATENFKNEVVINESKNVDSYRSSIQIGSPTVNKENNDVKGIEDGIKDSLAESHTDLGCNTAIVPDTKCSSVDAKASNVLNNKSKATNSILKTAINSFKSTTENKKTSTVSFGEVTNCLENFASLKTTTSRANTKNAKQTTKSPKEASKCSEVSACLNLNNELSVIPLNTGMSCVSLTSTSGGTTTVYSTINKSMCSTRTDAVQNCERDKTNAGNEKQSSVVNNILKETKNLKRKPDDDRKTPEVPIKQPKPTILNHSIGLMNLSNNHPLKKHSKTNRNGEHLLRSSDSTEKMPISTPTVTVNHVLVSQKSNNMDSNTSKPIIINQNVSNMQINRPSTPKSGHRGVQSGNVSTFVDKSAYNSLGSIGRTSLDKNSDNTDPVRGKTETSISSVNCVPKSTNSHPIHHPASYHTPIITPSQLPHHQNLNSLQIKSQAHNQTKSSVPLGSSTSQSNVTTSQNATATSQSNFATSTPSDPPSSQSSDSAPHFSIAQNSKDAVKPLVSTPTCSTPQNTPLVKTSSSNTVMSAQLSIKTKPSTPIGYKTLRDPPKSWNSQINSQIARANQNAKAQQIANAVAATQAGGLNAQGRFTGDLKNVRPAKFFKGRNMPRYLGCPVSGVKPMYQVQGSTDKEKIQETLAGQSNNKTEKSEIKKHSIVKIDPKTLRPISEKAPETSNLSNISSNLTLNSTQKGQELRMTASPADLKINTSSVSIFNPLKLQSSPKSERKSPKSPHSPKVKNNLNNNNPTAMPTSTSSSSPSSVNTLSPKQHRDKTNLTFTPPNPFVPNLTSPTLSPNQFLYPAGGFPSYDPRVMAAYHSLWYTQRMAVAAAAGFVPPSMPHAFNMNIGLNTGSGTVNNQQPHSPGVSSKHPSPPKTSNQPSSRGGGVSSSQTSKASPTSQSKKTKDSSTKNDKSLESALNKLTQNKVKESGSNKHSKKNGGGKDSSAALEGSQSACPKISDGSRSSSSHQEAESSRGTKSALQKLSHNRAIEILGNSIVRRSLTTGEKEGRNFVEGTPAASEKSSSTKPSSKDNNSSSAVEINEGITSRSKPNSDIENMSEKETSSSDQSALVSQPSSVACDIQARLGLDGPNEAKKSEKDDCHRHNRSDLDQNISNSDGNSADLCHSSKKVEDVPSLQERCAYSSKSDLNQTIESEQSSCKNINKTLSDNDKKDSNLNSSDIKSKNSPNPSDTSCSSSKNSENSSDKCVILNEQLSEKTTGSVANADAFSGVASGGSLSDEQSTTSQPEEKVKNDINEMVQEKQ